MITLSTNFKNACVKQTNQSIFKMDMETSYNRALVTMKEQWQGGTGDADINTMDGSVICKRNDVDIITGFSDNNLYFSNLVQPAVRIRTNKELYIYTHKIKYNFIGLSGVANVPIHLYEIEDDLPTYTTNFNIINLVAYGTVEYSPTAYADRLIKGMGYVKLEANKTYLMTFWLPATSWSGYMKYAPVTSQIFDNNILGQKVDDIMTMIPTRVTLGSDGKYYYNEFSGMMWFKYFFINKYQTSTYKTKLFAIKNQYNVDTAGGVGQFRASERSPIGSDVTYSIDVYDYSKAALISVSSGTATVRITGHGYSTNDYIWVWATGIPTSSYQITKTDNDTFTFTTTASNTSITGYCWKLFKTISDLSDGDEIDFEGRAQCRFGMTMETDNWYETPIVDAVEVYFPTTQSFVKSDDSLGTALPLLQSMPSYDSQIDPIASKCSISEPEFRIFIDKPDSKTPGEIETLIYSHYLTGNEVSVTFGFKGIADTADYCPVTTGIIKDYECDETTIKFNCSDVLRIAKDPLGLDSAGGIEKFVYAYENPCNIILDLLYRIGVPKRLINVTSFTNCIRLFSGWQFFRYFDELETDLKSLIDEVCELTELILVPQEDGVLYLRYLFSQSTVFTFNDNNSYPLGKAKINLEYRINECHVRRGFWDEYNCVENEDVEYYDRVINYDSLRQTNLNTVKVYDNKWIPKDVQIGGKYISQIVGQRKTQRFGYGVTTLKRITPISGDEYAKVQIADRVTIITDQILKHGIIGTNTFVAFVIGKKYNLEEATIEWTFWII